MNIIFFVKQLKYMGYGRGTTRLPQHAHSRARLLKSFEAATLTTEVMLAQVGTALFNAVWLIYCFFFSVHGSSAL